MTTDQLNLAIAKDEGITSTTWYCGTCRCVVDPKHVTYQETHDARYGGCGDFLHADIPNFCGDLNLMHDLEKKLPIQEQGEYWNYLASIATGFSEDDFDPNNEFSCFEVINATAAQRAEAYAKVKGIYKE